MSWRSMVKVILALGGTVLGLGEVFAEGPAQQVKPVVLFLLDTSGSMEYDVQGYLAESGDEDVLAVPYCSGVPGAQDGKSRFIVALEVLTGTFAPETYSCTYDYRTYPRTREDYGYPVPHIVPSGVQLENGLIDVAGDRFKFGIMTFDTNPSPSPQKAGGFSYGPESPINYGARNEGATTGWFVPPSGSDDVQAVLERNAQVEVSLRSVIPYGGTPLAPILRDALYYFQTDPAMQPYDPINKTGDLYYPCRSRNVVLITDGRATLGEGTEGYLLATQYAAQLLQAGVKVWVVGFQLPAGVETLMHAIAAAGGTQEARIATNPAQLAAVLSKILGNMETAVQSRTRIAVTSDTGNFRDRQYQFSAAYGLVEGRPGLFRGYLERSVYQCVSGDEASVVEVQDMAEKLNASPDSDRSIWTVVDGQLEEFVKGNGHLTLDKFGFEIPQSPGVLLLERRGPTLEGTCEPLPPLLDAYYENQRQLYVDYLIDFVRAAQGSCRYPYRFGAVVHSSPVIQGHLRDVDAPIPSFQTYKTQIRNRPTVLYVGTHDGMIHAFKVDRPDTYPHMDWGKELWAFIPNHLLKRVKVLPNKFEALMDGEPVVKDVLLRRTLSSLSSPQEEARLWRSVLITGYGRGGQGYVALDVTDPAQGPKFMWEISPEGRWWVDENGTPHFGGSNEFANDFTRLGFTVSRPAVGTVFLGSEEVAVAVFGAGLSAGPGTGKAVFVVRLDTGEKLAEFRSGLFPPNVIDPCGIGGNSEPKADMVGDVTCFSTFPGTFITRCFLGDMAGRLWRLDLGGSSTLLWRLQLFFDPYDSVRPKVYLTSPLRAPVYEAPSVAPRQWDSNLVIVFGGGDPDRIDDVTQKSFVASVTEMVPRTDQLDDFARCSPYTETVCRDPSHKTAVLNWKIFLGYDEHLHDLPRGDEDNLQPGEVVYGERLMGAPVIFSNTTFFTTFAPDLANACHPGIGWLWGVDFARRGDNCMDLLPRLDWENVPNQRRKVRIGGGSGASIPYGLVVAQKPACFSGQPPQDALPPSQCPNCTPLASLSPPKPMIIVQTAVQSSSTPDTTPPGMSAPPTVAKMTKKILSFIQSMLVAAWGFVFD